MECKSSAVVGLQNSVLPDPNTNHDHEGSPSLPGSPPLPDPVSHKNVSCIIMFSYKYIFVYTV